jgi:hypothetical protein
MKLVLMVKEMKMEMVMMKAFLPPSATLGKVDVAPK